MDMLLAEQGGVYTLIGTTCCTFIPNNKAPESGWVGGQGAGMITIPQVRIGRELRH